VVFDLVTLDLDHTAFLGNSVLYLSKSLGISEKLEELHADYRGGKISEKELNVLQAPSLQTTNLEKAFRALARGPVLKRLDRGVNILHKNGCDVQMHAFNPLQIYFFQEKLWYQYRCLILCGNLTTTTILEQWLIFRRTRWNC
jgi:hypothetical protein